jgi:Flp pilus assembly protein TadB
VILSFLPWVNKDSPFESMNEGLMSQLDNIGNFKLLITLLLLALCVILILRLFGIRSPGTAKGVSRALSDAARKRRRDSRVAAANKFLSRLTRLVNMSPFALPAYKREYIQYNLQRTRQKVIGGFRLVTADEWNAQIQFIKLILIVLSLVVALSAGFFAGLGIAAFSLSVMYIMPLSALRRGAAAKDRELKDEFPDFYSAIHYGLLTGARTPLNEAMRVYIKVTKSEQMIQFLDASIGYIETYGEELAMTKIAADYKEVGEILEITRLIKQICNGANVEQGLIGFHNQLMENRRVLMRKRTENLIRNARVSFYIIWLMAIQAFISSLGIYFPDLMKGGGMFKF